MSSLSLFYKQFLKRIKKIPPLDLALSSIFLIILMMVTFFFLRKADYVYVKIRVTTDENLQSNFYTQAPLWYAENLDPNLAEYDLLGRKNIGIEDIHYYPNNTTSQAVYVTLKVRSVFNKNTGQYSYNGTPLLVGNFHRFNLASATILGVIQDVYKEPPEDRYQTFIVTGELEAKNHEEIPNDAETEIEGVKTYIAEKLETELVVKDSRGKVIAKVVDVQKQPAYRKFISGSNLVNFLDDKREKVRMQVLVLSQEMAEKNVYKEEIPLVIGNVIPLAFENFSVQLTIHELELAEESL